MKTLAKAAFLSLILIVCGCGSPRRSVPSPCTTVPAQAGCSVLKTRLLGPPLRGGFPDVSSYQGCPSFYGPVIFKVYEGGYGEDRSAQCNAARVHRLHSWAGVYAFLRPANCAGQGNATAQIVKQLGGVPGPVVADAEVSLPSGCVNAFLRAVRTTLGGPVDVYTSPGTWPGGKLSAPLWVATYGPKPGCVGGVCSHVAWQFSDSGRCGGLAGVDCSLNSGILGQNRKPKPTPQPIPPKPQPRPPTKAALIAYLRSLARKHHCYRHGHKLHACAVWGTQVKALSR